VHTGPRPTTAVMILSWDDAMTCGFYARLTVSIMLYNPFNACCRLATKLTSAILKTDVIS